MLNKILVVVAVTCFFVSTASAVAFLVKLENSPRMQQLIKEDQVRLQDMDRQNHHYRNVG